MEEPWKQRLKAWSRNRNWLDKYLWGKENEEDYALRLTQSKYISFATMQIIRLCLWTFLGIIWLMQFYVNVKRSFFYLSFWALTFTFVSQILLFYASGHK